MKNRIKADGRSRAASWDNAGQMARLIEEYAQMPQIQQLEAYVQHGSHTVLDHSKNVARISCRINRSLHLGADENEVVTAAMLHDYFLYDWHDGRPERLTHGFTHAEAARRNAADEFDISEREQDMIRTHMWPLNITKVPKSKGAWLICLADKLAAVYEVVRRRRGE